MSKKTPVSVPQDSSASAADAALYTRVRGVLLQARQQAHHSVNTAMVQAYWHVGRHIVQSEQQGRTRATYGKAVLASLSGRLTEEFGKGYSAVNLRYFRQFYLAFPICHALSDKSAQDTPPLPELPPLTWTHIRTLLRVEHAEARAWYMREAVEQGWSVRALDRQISTLHYERLLSSQDRAGVQREAAQLIEREAPPDAREFIRDPYVLEFLGALPGSSLYEKDVEQGLLNRKRLAAPP